MKIAILGYGTIGKGVFETAKANDIEVVSVLDIRDLRGTEAASVRTSSFETVLSSDADVVVECMGGERPAYDFIKASLEKGKSAVTSNKAVVAAFGPELRSLAEEKGVKFLFEASVGGGIPIIRILSECLSCDRIHAIRGILNGTTNYILTKMSEGSTYEDALRSARSLGYAEADPSADVDGWDSCRKIAILGWIISGKLLDYRTIPTEGITKLTPMDISAAKQLGKRYRLIARFTMDGDKVSASVAPEMLSREDPLYNVDNVMNGILSEGTFSGTTLYCGAGAGSLPTASAVIADVLHCPEKNRIS